MTRNRLTYFEALGLAAPSAKTGRVASPLNAISSADADREARYAALERAHEIRQFEIELYWKRATYFWILQAAVFTALGLIWKGEAKPIPEIVPIALAALGLLTASAGWFSSQGSKFWQENWERHIDMLEDEFEGKLHKTAWVGEMGVRWSVSNINDRLILFFVLFWLLVFIVVDIEAVPHWSFGFAHSINEINVMQMTAMGAVCITAVALFCLYMQKSNLRGACPDWTEEDEVEVVQPGAPRLFRRLNDAPFVVKRGQAR